MKLLSGAAHGYSGIIYFILQFWDDLFLNDQLAFKLAENNMKQFLQQFGNSFKQTIWELIINTLEYCLSFGFGDEDQGSAQLVITDYPKNISVKVRKCPFCLTRNYMGLSNGAL